MLVTILHVLWFKLLVGQTNIWIIRGKNIQWQLLLWITPLSTSVYKHLHSSVILFGALWDLHLLLGVSHQVSRGHCWICPARGLEHRHGKIAQLGQNVSPRQRGSSQCSLSDRCHQPRCWPERRWRRLERNQELLRKSISLNRSLVLQHECYKNTMMTQERCSFKNWLIWFHLPDLIQKLLNRELDRQRQTLFGCHLLTFRFKLRNHLWSLTTSQQSNHLI